MAAHAQVVLHSPASVSAVLPRGCGAHTQYHRVAAWAAATAVQRNNLQHALHQQQQARAAGAGAATHTSGDAAPQQPRMATVPLPTQATAAAQRVADGGGGMRPKGILSGASLPLPGTSTLGVPLAHAFSLSVRAAC
jgi:hypothetical protein